ncbi:MAG: cheB5 [Clostridia bacterium]|jgi:two-component system chemotaxis response regulator CheB|nr:cheB5 [Clostridia bacterium]
MRKVIRVLVVDDSLLFREVLSRGISTDLQIEVVAKAVDPFDATDKIMQFQPDVIISDVEMPKMNGIEFIRRLLPQYPVPVIVVSAVSEAVFDAMNAGAVDFVTKPDVQSPRGVEEFINDLIRKIKIAVHARVRPPNTLAVAKPQKMDRLSRGQNEQKVIAIGASTGGTEAIFSILKQLPFEMPAIVIVQHIPPIFSKMFSERLDKQTQFRVKEAQTGEYLEEGTVYIAPGNQQMKVKKIGSRHKLQIAPGDKVNGHCPSVDVLFESVAQECGEHAIGIILTGMGYDGAKGLLAMKRRGARTIGQDEASSVVYGMPKVAFHIGAVDKQVALENIPQVVCGMLR